MLFIKRINGFHSLIALYAVTSTSKSAFILGGWNGRDANADGIKSSIIAEFSNSVWTKKGYMTKARSYHSAITFHNHVMIIGDYK